MTKKKGEVKISVKGNPYSQNNQSWNFGVYKTDNMNVNSLIISLVNTKVPRLVILD